MFAAPIYGSFSVWLTTHTGADIFSGNYLTFSAYTDGTHNYGSIGTQDYDLGPGQNGSNYYVNPLSDQISISNLGVDRTQGWHHFLIDDTPAGATFQIDGHTVSTASGALIDHIRLSMRADWRPAWTSYFDDFEYKDFNPDIAATQPSWNTAQGGVDFGYTISGADLPQATTVNLYWASGTTFDTGRIGDPIVSHPTQTAQGTYEPIPLHVTADQMGNLPDGAKYLLVVANPPDESNNCAVVESDRTDYSDNIKSIDLSGGPGTIYSGGVTLPDVTIPDNTPWSPCSHPLEKWTS